LLKKFEIRKRRFVDDHFLRVISIKFSYGTYCAIA